MKEAAKILAYLIGIVVLGSLLAPPLWWAGQAVAPHFPWLAFLETTDFQRFFNRAILIAAILLLWPTIRWLRIGSLGGLGLEPNPRRFRDFGIGFAIASLSLFALGAVLLQAGTFRLKAELPWDDLPGILVTALVVATLEESLFRGGIQGLVARSAGPRVALWFVAALFSIVHFLKPREEVIAEVGWGSGFALVPHAFWQFGDPARLIAGFTTLFAVGLILGHVTLRTRSLALAIGLHAGWVFALKTFSRLTKRLDRDVLPWLGDNLLEGVGPLLVLAVTWVAVLLCLRHRSHETLVHGRP